MTPTQLRSYATVVRCGSVRVAARELGVSEAAVSGNVGALRKELDDRLFHPSHSGLVFTPGGLRLAQRAVEMLGLQELTRREVGDAGAGRRHLRIAATSVFAEYAAPGLIEAFSTRAADLEVELVVEPSTRFEELLFGHRVDVTIGPGAAEVASGQIESVEFLRYGIVGVCAPGAGVSDLSRARWCLGPSVVEAGGATRAILERLGVADEQQRIYPSHAQAVGEAKTSGGVALVPKFVADRSTGSGDLVLVEDRRCAATGTWTAACLAGDRASGAARELLRFVATPRAIQAMLAGSGSRIGRVKPRVHITLWS